jgi:ribonuclease R
MSRHKKPKKKFKQSLSHIIRKVFLENKESSLSHKQICARIDLQDKQGRKIAFRVLEDLVKIKYLNRAGQDFYTLNKSDAFNVGYIQITNRGSGFVTVDNGENKDVYIPPNQVQQALDGDRVKIQITKKSKSRNEGAVLEVIERERTKFVGVIQMHDNFAFLIPDNARVNTDIYIPKEKLKGAKNGDRALVKITTWPKSSENPYGDIIQILNSIGSNDLEMISILVNQGLDYVFPIDVLSESETVRVALNKKEVLTRRDFRNTTTFTIDPQDAKDFDDALSFKQLKSGNVEIGIHIADVSHYVRPGTAMDTEAFSRSNSVYLVDRVIPMLPEQLSNLVCSLRPEEDKFTFSAVFEINENGKIFNEWFGKTVIHSNRRFTYEETQEIIEGGNGDFASEILVLDKIAKILRKSRLKNGAMNIESSELRFRLNEKGDPEEVLIKTSKDAHKLVEEYMLLANRKVATLITKQNKSTPKCVYRCHDKPDIQKIGLFSQFISKFGYDIDLSNPDHISKNINALLHKIRNKNEFSLIQTMAIRSMAKASYETNNIGHYGLAFDYYSHFTSPIRRYADLVVHRILQEVLTSKKHSFGKNLNNICKRISRMERKAMEAERESTKYFQALFVMDKIGNEFSGTISGITEFGLFVKMDENQCEGMVAINDIAGDRFHFDPDKFAIIGSKKKKQYSFGDSVRVIIYEVSIKKRQISLELISNS